MPRKNTTQEDLKAKDNACVQTAAPEETSNTTDAVQTTAPEETADTTDAVQTAEATVEQPSEKARGGQNALVDDGYVTYCLPYLPGVKPGEYQTVTINGKNYQVKYGEPVRMPSGVAEVLQQMVKSRTRIEDKIKRLQEEKCITKLE